MCNFIYYNLIICSSSYLYFFIFHLFTPNITQRKNITYIYISIHNAPIPIYSKKVQVLLSEQNWPPPKHLSKLVSNNTTLNLIIAAYFLNILVPPDISTWYTTCGPITKTIKHIGITKHHRRTVEITLLRVYSCQDMGVEYTQKKMLQLLTLR